jgi:hypothetical protein
MRFSTHEYAFRLHATPQHKFLTLDEETAAKLRQVTSQFQQLATWNTYALSPEVKHMLKDMETSASSRSFSSEYPLTSGFKQSSSTREVFDATTPVWTIPLETSHSADTTRVTSAAPSPTDQGSTRRDIGAIDTAPGLRRSARLRAGKARIGIFSDPNPKGVKKWAFGSADGNAREDFPLIIPPSTKQDPKYGKTHFPPVEKFLQHVNEFLSAQPYSH